MAIRLVKWSVDGSVLKISKPTESNVEVVIEAEFDLSVIYPTFDTMTTVQKQLILKGTKEKLSDTGAGSVADQGGKISAAKKKWQELLDGKWEGDRINGTGASEDKAALKVIKEAKKTVTLTGLMMKKLTDAAHFTEEDQAKLDEFIIIAAESLK
jgi:hypothetical protein